MNIIKYPNDILVTSCTPVTKEDLDIDHIILDMVVLMKSAKGVGLAATQVGISKTFFLITDNHNNIIPILNPKILETDGLITMSEGCLSLSGIYLDISRPENVFVEYQDLQFETKKAMLTGNEARIFLHEYDHISQKFFLDKVSRQVRRRILQQLK